MSVTPVTDNYDLMVPPKSPREDIDVDGGKNAWIPMDPMLYESTIKADLNLLDIFLRLRGSREHTDVAIDISNGDSPLKVPQLDGCKSLLGTTFGGNTALHIVAGSSLTEDRKAFANKIYMRESSLLTTSNKFGETPLHCAAKAGNLNMVTLLINFAKEEHQDDQGDHRTKVRTFLRVRNKRGETALHEAVRLGNKDLVEKLLTEDLQIASIADNTGSSPLYMAAMEDSISIVKVFTTRPKVSCPGPMEQTALHAAVVLQNTGITQELLEWDPTLASKVDKQGDTPLHYAVSVGNLKSVLILLKHDRFAFYTPNKDGMFPVHIAGKMGWTDIIKEFVSQFPDSGELCDKEGKNFLHVAIESRKKDTVKFIMGNPTCVRMLNIRDEKGNTPLHLAVENSSYGIVRAIISKETSYSNILNEDGFTPLDLAVKKASTPVLWFSLNPEYNILRCLAWLGAVPSPRPLNRNFELKGDTEKIKEQEKYKNTTSDKSIEKEQEKKNNKESNKTIGEEQEKYKSIASNISIGSVLVATVTFAAIFTMPGGYEPDSNNAQSGTPVLSTKYAFKVFVISDSLAFILSILSTIYIMYAGSANVNWKLRERCLLASVLMMVYAAKALVCGFASAAFVLLSPVNFPLSIFICVLAVLALCYNHPFYQTFFKLAFPLWKRLGFRGLFKSHFHPVTLKRIPVPISTNITEPISRNALGILIFYGLIFVLAFFL
ncbi:hypothetical protein LUZ60_016366 [Juncus effusus]|nr:hypothetical protein LUZ60_016366 [Juncus effusus]